MTVVRHQLSLRNLPVRALILAHKGSAIPRLVNDRAVLHLRRIWCVPTRYRTIRLSARVLPASRMPPPSRRALNCTRYLGRGADLETSSTANHTAAASQPTGQIAKTTIWGEPGPIPAGKISHTHTPETMFRRERARDAEVTWKPSDTLGREFDPGKPDFFSLKKKKSTQRVEND